ncbi:MAG TPA: voltage-gated potassium channel protein [Acetobacteraceae bacterium]|nr:voltage-gated potassium channel protein [Acetobacteraceae bacterium]
MVTSIRTVFPRRWSLYRAWRRRLRMDLWFPHVPLALAVGGAGIFALLPTIRIYAAEYLHLDLDKLLKALHPISGEFPQLILAGVPATMVGVLQLLVAIGLLLRSRVSWLLALGLTVIQLVLAVHGNAGRLVSSQAIYVVALFVALVAARRWFNWSSLAANMLFALASILWLIVYGVLGAYLLGSGFAPSITNLPMAFYFTIVTMSTVGYGDIVPKTTEARLFVVSLIVLGLTLFATAFTAIIGPAVQRHLDEAMGRRRKPMEKVNHFIITGRGVLAHNTARELHRRSEKVLIIAENEDTSFGDAEVMVGDPTELETLRAAGAEHARAVLALSEDDSENAFVILAMHELASEAKKVAAVSSRKNLERVRRVRPDMIMAAPVFAGEVLAMALTEEKIDGQWLLNRVLDVGSTDE